MKYTKDCKPIFSKSELVTQNNDLLKSIKKDIQSIIDINDLYTYEKDAYKDLVNIQNEIQAQININERK